MIDHRAILKKLMLQEWDFFGECQTLGCLEDGASSYVQFTDEEKAEVKSIVDEAHVDYLVERFPVDTQGNDVNDDAALGRISRPDVIGGV